MMSGRSSNSSGHGSNSNEYSYKNHQNQHQFRHNHQKYITTDSRDVAYVRQAMLLQGNGRTALNGKSNGNGIGNGSNGINGSGSNILRPSSARLSSSHSNNDKKQSSTLPARYRALSAKSTMNTITNTSSSPANGIVGLSTGNVRRLSSASNRSSSNSTHHHHYQQQQQHQYYYPHHNRLLSSSSSTTTSLSTTSSTSRSKPLIDNSSTNTTNMISKTNHNSNGNGGGSINTGSNSNILITNKNAHSGGSGSKMGVNNGSVLSKIKSTSNGSGSGSSSNASDVIIIESAQFTGVHVAQRSSSSKEQCPERLNLDRRGLRSCCLLQGEEQLRLLNYQHNNITKIRHLNNLHNLVFLDMYNNCITEISGLEYVPNIRVLMLGRNNIRIISGIESLRKLDVLDIHSNHISRIEGLKGLVALRILNLAGNLITSMEDLSMLTMLTELNLRRNALDNFNIIPSPPTTTAFSSNNIHQQRDTNIPVKNPFPSRLQRFFLSHNKINSIDDLEFLADLPMLRELALDGNPLAVLDSKRSLKDYRSTVIRMCAKLTRLDMSMVTDEEKRTAMHSARVKSLSGSSQLNNAEKKVIDRKNLQSQASEETLDDGEEEVVAENVELDKSESSSSASSSSPTSSVSCVDNHFKELREDHDAIDLTNAKSNSQMVINTETKVSQISKSDQSSREHKFSSSMLDNKSLLKDVEQVTLAQSNVKNQMKHANYILVSSEESLNALEKVNSGNQMNIDLTRMKGSTLRKAITKLKNYPLASLKFTDTGLRDLMDLSPLSFLCDLRNLHISELGNPVVADPHFRHFLCVCMSNLKMLNGTPVTSEFRLHAGQLMEPFFEMHKSNLKVSPIRASVLQQLQVQDQHASMLALNSQRDERSTSSALVADNSANAAILCRQLDTRTLVEMKTSNEYGNRPLQLSDPTTDSFVEHRDIMTVNKIKNVDYTVYALVKEIVSSGSDASTSIDAFEKSWPRALEILVSEALSR